MNIRKIYFRDVTEKDKFVKCDVSSSMIIPSIAELPDLLQSGFNG